MTEKCLICKKELPNKGTAYSMCYDAEYNINVWGGDSHEYIGCFCDECAEKIKKGAT